MPAADHVTGLEISEKKSNKMAASQRQWSEDKESELIYFYAGSASSESCLFLGTGLKVRGVQGIRKDKSIAV
ncbi:hypothetical protein DPX16_10838 [Anabarilius grahami]|uniref:Uncharacterized protein n=1 Tax=Anabarilius grahami TaxID=495550 RepID=A0A3N0Z7K5_ANAGA|nr:hypothetical protein DPX16_10838 [Anabarilius grahami]